MRTFQQTIDNLADYPITIQSDYCSEVIIFENGQAGTQNLLIKDAVGGPYILFPAGVKIPISKLLKNVAPFSKGQRIGSVQTAAGSFVLSQYEY